MKVYRSLKAEKHIIDTYNQLLALWDIDKQEIDLPTSYGTTHVILCGKENNPPLVLFHGVGDDSALMWLYNAKELGQHFKLYAVDTIGGPGKSRTGKNYNADFDDVIWIDEILNTFNLKKASFLGVSHGGYLVQLYTLLRPERVDCPICLSSAVPVGNSGSPMKTMMKIFLPEALFPTRHNVTKLLKKLSGTNYGAFTENAVIMEHYRWLLKGFNNLAMAYHKVRTFSDEEILQLKDKVYYLAGLEDPFQKMGGTKALKSYNMNVRFFTGAGHGINHELAGEINKMIIKIMENKEMDLRNF